MGSGEGEWVWRAQKVTMFSTDALDKDAGDVDSHSRGTNDEYFIDEVTDTLEGWGFKGWGSAGW